jgi:hypothetical protein
LSGSTLLWRLLQTSPHVSALPNEGQYLQPVRKIMLPDRWNPELKLPWAKIKDEWHKFWDLEKPLLLDKSVPNLIRAKQIEAAFPGAHFVAMVRDPYAQCEGIVRRRHRLRMLRQPERLPKHLKDTPRTGSTRDYAMELAVRQWVWMADRQMRNVQELERVIHFTYEDLAG